MLQLLSYWAHKRGRRGAMLTWLGLIYLTVGWGVLVYPAGRVTDHVFHLLLPLPIRVGVWVVAGVAAIIWAHRRDDTVGWFLLYIPPAIRVLSYLGSFAFWVVTGGAEGSALAGALAFTNGGSFVGVVLICSGWREGAPKHAS